ncbi:hypothetical protein BGX24_003313 [Mortierella sp. AD032]|nr:hypothetical protein BGX24_003313 [Mortierella sp. AD032]
MFPHLRTPIIERLYVACFVTTRLGYVSLLWHEIYYNYPDKSVTFLYTITISLHVYWFVLYIKTQRRFAAKKRRQQLCTVLNAMAHALKEEFVASVVESAEISNVVGGGMAEVEEQKGGEAHVKGHGRGEHAEELDPLLNQSSRKKRNEVKEEDDLLLPLPDTNVRLRRRSSPQV